MKGAVKPHEEVRGRAPSLYSTKDLSTPSFDKYHVKCELASCVCMLAVCICVIPVVG